jgi:hypothetical protein
MTATAVKLRTVTAPGGPWWVARDVLGSLGLNVKSGCGRLLKKVPVAFKKRLPIVSEDGQTRPGWCLSMRAMVLFIGKAALAALMPARTIERPVRRVRIVRETRVPDSSRRRRREFLPPFGGLPLYFTEEEAQAP